MQPVIIRRSRTVILGFLAGYSLLLLMGALHETGLAEVEGASHWLFRLFLAAFILPVFVCFCALWIQRQKPIVAIGQTYFEFRSGLFLEKVLRIKKAGVLGVSTHWQGPNSDSASDLIFSLDEGSSSIAELSSVFRRRADGWYFEFGMAEATPFKAVEMIRRSAAETESE